MDGNTIPMNSSAEPKRKGISGSTLKLIAIFTMLIDHTAATILDNILNKRGMSGLDYNNVQAVNQFYADNQLILNIDQIMRLIGRLAFPIFCFLLVQGMIHTHNKYNYMLRLGIFALISEIPFDLAFKAKLFDMDHQNVFFTLFIGLVVMIGFDMISNVWRRKKWLPVLSIAGAIALGFIISYLFTIGSQILAVIMRINVGKIEVKLNTTAFLTIFMIFTIISLFSYLFLGKMKSFDKINIYFANLAVIITGMILSEFLNTDYSAFGVLTIAIMYGLRKNHTKAMLGGCITLTVMSLGEFTSFLDILLIHRYNGTRGIHLKYVFYLFYPVHLFVLYLICYFMHII